jgi:phosphoribosylanthranilate isomerase
VVDVKFCGLTRRGDALLALELGASYLGVILAGGPRSLSTEAAAEVAAASSGSENVVAVFGRKTSTEIANVARHIGAGVVQLHSDPTAAEVRSLRAEYSGRIWAAARVEGKKIPEGSAELFRVADAVVLDPRVPGQLGGTGVTLPWRDLAVDLARLRAEGSARLVLAGGLTPENVGEAIEMLGPDIVDVSSGVESTPGIKDHNRMRAFAAAVGSWREQQR